MITNLLRGPAAVRADVVDAGDQYCRLRVDARGAGVT